MHQNFFEHSLIIGDLLPWRRREMRNRIATMIYILPDQLSSLFGNGSSTVNAVEKGIQSIDIMVASLDEISKDKAWYEISNALASILATSEAIFMSRA